MSSRDDLTGTPPRSNSLDPAAGDRLAELLEQVLLGLDLDAQVQVCSSDGQLSAAVTGPDAEALIGRDGSTLDAVQYLAQRIVFVQRHEAPRVFVDAAGHRARRAQALTAIAEEAAEEALRSGGAVVLKAMPASERRVVHEYLADRTDVITHSEGDEPRRHLVISPTA